MAPSPLSAVLCVGDRPDLTERLSAAPQEWGPSRILKHDKKTIVRLVSLPLGAVVTKHCRLRHWGRVGDALLHGSPARRSWQGAHLLHEHGFCVPRPLAVLERRRAGTVRESVYVSQGLVGQVGLDRYWQERHIGWSVAQQRRFLAALADFLRRFHGTGLYAGDMKDANLFVEAVGDTDWRFYLVDLDRVQRFPALSLQRRLKNLVQLERTLGCQVRLSLRVFFLYRYLGTPLPPARRRRALLRQLVGLRDRKDREYTRRRARQRSGAVPPVPQDMSASAMPRRASISCFIVCQNEAAHLRRCLESVKWCDEIIVVDSFSSDQTVQICQEYTDRIIQRAWPGYVEQKRFALSQTRYDWVLNIDADEEVSPALQHDIVAILVRDDPAVDGFYIPRLVYYLGRWWWHGWYPSHRLRLFRKPKVRWGGIDPHEKVVIRGQADRLSSNIYHYTYENITDHLRTVNHLTDVASHQLARRGPWVRVGGIVFRPLWRFVRFYVLSGCIQEGRAGFFVSVTAAFYTFLKYAKLWEHTLGRPHDEQRRAGRSAC